MYTLVKSLKGYKPLACRKDLLILSKGRTLYFSDLNLIKIRKICSLPKRKRTDSIPRVRLVERVLRQSIGSFLFTGESSGLVVRNSDIFRLDLNNGNLFHEMTVPDGKKILALSYIPNWSETNDMVVFGEYSENVHMDVVNVWGRKVKNDAGWEVLFSFAAGLINHIHSIVAAPELGGVIMLTGDFDHAAGMWLYLPSTGELKPLLVGSQEYRATWLHRLGANYMYATDSQLVTNSLCNVLLQQDGGAVSRIADIEGSSIYVGYGKDICYFSSTVEPGAPSGRFIRDVFARDIGSGIRSDNAYIYSFDAISGLFPIFFDKKDRWPPRLAQFGTFSFPSGLMPEGYLYAYGQALEHSDDCCLFFQRNKPAAGSKG